MAKNDAPIEGEIVDEQDEQGSGVVAQYNVGAAIASLNDSSASHYSSIKQDTFAGKRAVAKALANSEPIADNLHKEFNLAHVIVQQVGIADEKTGEVTDSFRVTLITDEGQAYHGTSVGLFNSVRQLLSSLGEPESWDEPIPVKVVEKRGRSGWRYQTIELV